MCSSLTSPSARVTIRTPAKRQLLVERGDVRLVAAKAGRAPRPAPGRTDPPMAASSRRCRPGRSIEAPETALSEKLPAMLQPFALGALAAEPQLVLDRGLALHAAVEIAGIDCDAHHPLLPLQPRDQRGIVPSGLDALGVDVVPLGRPEAGVCQNRTDQSRRVWRQPRERGGGGIPEEVRRHAHARQPRRQAAKPRCRRSLSVVGAPAVVHPKMIVTRAASGHQPRPNLVEVAPQRRRRPAPGTGASHGTPVLVSSSGRATTISSGSR